MIEVVDAADPDRAGAAHRRHDGTERLVVEGHRGGKLLIPDVAEICTGIDVARRRIVVSPPAGLLEINERRES